jgi:hypothetical protein
MLDGEVGKDQCVPGGDRFGLSNDVPRRGETPELSSEALLDPAVVAAGLAPGRSGRRPELQREPASLEDACRA